MLAQEEGPMERIDMIIPTVRALLAGTPLTLN
jgi:hypothetical protein